jgi:hypothetical protein
MHSGLTVTLICVFLFCISSALVHIARYIVFPEKRAKLAGEIALFIVISFLTFTSLVSF